MSEPMRPPAAEHAPYFDRYISLVPGDRVIPVLIEQLDEFAAMMKELPEDRALFRYAPGKWSVKECVGHIIDTERVFAHRALWIARGSATPLAGFSQDDYVAAAHHDAVPLDELMDEFTAMREGHILMLSHLPTDAWTRVGTAGDNPLSTRAAAFITAGHLIHHLTLFRVNYGF